MNSGLVTPHPTPCFLGAFVSTTNTETPTIRSKYSDDQLRDALITATELRERIFIRGTVGADGAYGSQHWSEDQINDLHTILNVLQTLEDSQGTDAVDGEDAQHGVLQAASDEWEPANLETIEMTDEAILALYADGTGVQGVPFGIGEDDLYITVHGQQHHVTRTDLVKGRAWLYRIPAPIVHPDPGVHPIIMNATIRYEETAEHKAGTQTAELLRYSVWNGWVGISVDGDALSGLRTEQIIEWTPADIVPKQATGESSD